MIRFFAKKQQIDHGDLLRNKTLAGFRRFTFVKCDNYSSDYDVVKQRRSTSAWWAFVISLTVRIALAWPACHFSSLVGLIETATAAHKPDAPCSLRISNTQPLVYTLRQIVTSSLGDYSPLFILVSRPFYPFCFWVFLFIFWFVSDNSAKSNFDRHR